MHGLCMFTAQPRCQVILSSVACFWAVLTDLTPGPFIPLGMVYILQVYGKYLGFHCSFSVIVPGGCCSQGCHGYPKCFWLDLSSCSTFLCHAQFPKLIYFWFNRCYMLLHRYWIILHCGTGLLGLCASLAHPVLLCFSE